MARQRTRLDRILVRRGLFDSRSKARAAIMAGQVYVDGERIDKAGTAIRTDAHIDIEHEDPYVSRGGIKLRHALDTFGLHPQGLTCIDVGASTGGFTDCLLQSGAARVVAVDVGYGQLAWTLRQDPRVVVVERTNFRHSRAGDFPKAHLVVIDVSFISLTKIIPAVPQHLIPGGDVVALVKPQFEAGREKVGKKGIVSDRAVHKDVLRTIGLWAETEGWSVSGLTSSPIVGARGNIEFFIWLGRWGEPSDRPTITDADEHWTDIVETVVEQAHGDSSS